MNKRQILLSFAIAVLLFALVTHIAVDNVSARYKTEFSFSDLIPVSKNYYSVTYYDADGTTVLNSAGNEKIQRYYGESYTIEDTYNARVTLPSGASFKAWVNAGGQTVTLIEGNNKEDIALYPAFNNLYTARFMDITGRELLKSVTFNNSTSINTLIAEAEDIDTAVEGNEYIFQEWQVRNSDGTYTSLSDYNPRNATGDIVVIPNYSYNGKLNLKPVDKDGDGDVDYYSVEAMAQLDNNVIIPGYVYIGSNEVPVKVVTDLTSSNWADNVTSIEIQEGVERIETGAFADTPSLKQVVLPNSLEYLGSSAFVNDGWLGNFGGLVNYKILEITYNGTRAEWDTLIENSADDWDNNLGTGTKIICEDGTYTLTQTGGSIFGKKEWVWKDN